MAYDLLMANEDEDRGTHAEAVPGEADASTGDVMAISDAAEARIRKLAEGQKDLIHVVVHVEGSKHHQHGADAQPEQLTVDPHPAAGHRDQHADGSDAKQYKHCS